jgi:hypothetical protein
VRGAGDGEVTLSGGSVIPTRTLVWTAGTTSGFLVFSQDLVRGGPR